MNRNIKYKENITKERKSTRKLINNIFKIAMMIGIVFSLLINIATATNFGDVIGTYRGVDAKSNGPCTGLYSGIYENTNCESSQNWIYQCIEYVERFYKDVMGIDTSKWGDNADEYYATASDKGLDAYPNGGEMPPKINDILAFSGGPYGHVAIITEVNNTSVKLVEQNFNRDTAYSTLQRNGNTIQNHITSTGITYTVQGWLRKNVLQEESFRFSVDHSFLTVNVWENAIYNLTVNNTGNATDIYSLEVTNKPNNTSVSLDKNSVTVGSGNSSVVRLTVNSSVTGIYTVNVTATSNTNANDSTSVTTVTKVVMPVLAIENFTSVPSTAISNVNSAKISANVKKGIYNITKVEFGLVDNNNLLGKGPNMIFGLDSNLSGAQGLYSFSRLWPGAYATIGNVATADIVTVRTDSSFQGYLLVIGTLKTDNVSNGTDAILFFNKTTGSLSNITDLYGELLNIQESDNTFRAKIFFTNGSVRYASENVSKLYSVTGNIAADNPRVIVHTVPNGKYGVYVGAKDTNNSIVSSWINIDTIPAQTGGSNNGGSNNGGSNNGGSSSGGSSSGGSSSGGSSSGGSSSGGDSTYPTVTPTQKKNATSTIVTPTVVTTVQPVIKTVSETPIATTAKGSPGFEIVAAIGMLGTIYILRRIK